MLTELAKLNADARMLIAGTRSQKQPPYKVSWVLYRLLSFEFLVVIGFRISCQLYQNRLTRPVALLNYFFHKLLFKVDMHPAAKIGAGLQLVHGFSVVIGANSIIGIILQYLMVCR